MEGSGIVYLVGAGPGDPGCLTLRGRDCLSRADVVVYDHLANADLLALAPPSAERVFAGKHGTGRHLLEQGEINDLLVRRAREGRTVVRLKGGDPFLFGRGGEEAEALRAAGLPFEVVPGVSAAIAVPAFAGIPVTHRDWVSGVTVLTGHEAGERSRVDWDRVARAGNTIVLLMGVTQMRSNLARLLAAGLAADTPAAAIRWGGTPRQQTLVDTASGIADAVERASLRPPVTLVLGPTVRLRERLDWFERRLLFGRRVVVTRARAQAGRMSDLLREQGVAVVEVPAIEIVPPDSSAPLDAALDRIETYDWIVFTSVNGVERFVAALDARGLDLRAMHRASLAAIGPETARALEALHLRPDVVPRDHRAEGLLERMRELPIEGKRILLPRAAGARKILPEELAAAGALVDEVVTYRSRRPPGSIEILREALDEGPLDAVAFTSSSTVRGFLSLLDEADPERGRERIRGTTVACIGPITAATAAEEGLSVSVSADPYTVPSLVAAIARHFGAGTAAERPRSSARGEES
ncbi:MAG: uroporphyrinogen-III C-methyltransferase [Alphaproteobacteria bacterium]